MTEYSQSEAYAELKTATTKLVNWSTKCREVDGRSPVPDEIEQAVRKALAKGSNNANQE